MSGATNNTINMPHLVIIDGLIGAGKSTLIANLSKQLNALVVPEYIEAPNGTTQLNRYLNDKQRYAYDFQLYILDYYRETITSSWFIEQVAQVDYVIMERNPLRGVTYFAKLDLLNGYITVQQYHDLYFKALKIVDDIKHTFNIYSNNMSTTYNTTMMTPSELTHSVLDTMNWFNEIDLIADPPCIKQRIHKRNREGEVDAYDDDYINYMCLNYFK